VQIWGQPRALWVRFLLGTRDRARGCRSTRYSERAPSKQYDRRVSRSLVECAPILLPTRRTRFWKSHSVSSNGKERPCGKWAVRRCSGIGRQGMKEKTAVCVAPAWPVTGFVRVNACSPTDLTRHMLGLGLRYFQDILG